MKSNRKYSLKCIKSLYFECVKYYVLLQTSFVIKFYVLVDMLGLCIQPRVGGGEIGQRMSLQIRN